MRPGAKAYSAAEKADLLEKFIHSTQAGKSKRDAAAELGMHPTTLMHWRALVERGETLTDSDDANRAKRPRPKQPPPRTEHELATKVEAVKRYKAREKSMAELAAEYGVHFTTIAKWVRDHRDGKLSAQRHHQPQLTLVEQHSEPEPARKARTGRRPKKGRLGKIELADEPAAAPAAAASMSPEQVEIAMLRAENARLKRALDAVIASR